MLSCSDVRFSSYRPAGLVCLKVSCQSHVKVFSGRLSVSVCVLCREKWRKLQSSFRCLRLRPQTPPTVTYFHRLSECVSAHIPLDSWRPCNSRQTHKHTPALSITASAGFHLVHESLSCVLFTSQYRLSTQNIKINRDYNVSWTMILS